MYEEAQVMLKQIIQDKVLRATGLVGFYPANSVGDDIELYVDEAREIPVATYFGLRQQAEKVGYLQLLTLY